MKILFVDNKSIQNSIRTGLIEQMTNHETYLFDNTLDSMDFFTKEHPEMVVVDYSLDFALETLHYILTLNPAQHIISLSDSLDCAEDLGCDFCIEHYRKKRVLKDHGMHDLLYLIDNFSQMPCEYAHKLDQNPSSNS